MLKVLLKGAELRQASVKSPAKGELSSAYALLTEENQTNKACPWRFSRLPEDIDGEPGGGMVDEGEETPHQDGPLEHERRHHHVESDTGEAVTS